MEKLAWAGADPLGGCPADWGYSRPVLLAPPREEGLAREEVGDDDVLFDTLAQSSMQ